MGAISGGKWEDKLQAFFILTVGAIDSNWPGLAKTVLKYSRPPVGPSHSPAMSKQSRLSLLLLLATLACSGCAHWKRPEFNLNSLRDPRAVDIDDRLSAPPLDTRDRKGE